jgi:hypothetical protein
MRYWYAKLLDDLFVKKYFEVDGGEVNFETSEHISHFWGVRIYDTYFV